MKEEIRGMIETAIIKNFPITNKLEGWYFRIKEISAGVYVAEGKDLFGRQVSREGTDPDKILSMCVNDAKQMKEL